MSAADFTEWYSRQFTGWPLSCWSSLRQEHIAQEAATMLEAFRAALVPAWAFKDISWEGLRDATRALLDRIDTGDAPVITDELAAIRRALEP